MKTFYDKLENIKSFNPWITSKKLFSSQVETPQDRKKLKLERTFLCYHFNEGKLIPNGYSTDDKGLSIKTSLNKEAIEYLIKRIDQTENPFLLARYNHLLWQETKHNRYVETTVKNYLIALEHSKNEETQVLNVLMSLIIISKKTKVFQSIVNDTITPFFNRSCNFKYKYSLLKTACDISFYNKKQLFTIVKDIPNWISFKTGADYFNNLQILEFALKQYQKLEMHSENLFELLALNEDLILKRHRDNESFVRIQHVAQQAIYYGKAGNKNESDRCYVELNNLKETVKMSNVTIDFDSTFMERLNSILKVHMEAILQSDPDNILAYFSIKDEFLSDPDITSNEVKKKASSSIKGLFATTVLDINNNMKVLSEGEKINKETLDLYSISTSMTYLNLFIQVLYEGILIGKINYENVYDYFTQKTWFGVKTPRAMTDDSKNESSIYFSLIAPAIQNFLSQIELSYFFSSKNISNYILAIDSMTLKFESALRNFIKIMGGVTTKEVNGVNQEQHLEQLINNEIISKCFSKKDVSFFNYVLTKEGKNIRNNVAHSFYLYTDYNFEKAALVFLCLLKLGKYELTKKNK